MSRGIGIVGILFATAGLLHSVPASGAATPGTPTPSKPPPPGPALSSPGNGHLKGTAAFRERIALPPDAVLEVVLEDVSRADAPAETIGRSLREGPGNPPIPFEIAYDPSRIDTGHRYAVRARVTVGEKLWFATAQSYPVLTAGKRPQNVAVLLKRPASTGAVDKNADAAAFNLPLEKTYWKLTSLGDPPVTVAAGKMDANVVFDPDARRVSGSGGCNRFTGSYTLQSERLELSDMSVTMMACAAGMETETAFLDALPRARSWRIRGRRLDLLEAGGKIVAGFEGR